MVSDEGDTLRQAVFGANDGLVSTFGLVAGLVGAAVATNVLLIAAFVNMIAAGMSMGFGSYLATKSEYEFHKKIRDKEKKKIADHPQKAEAELMFMLRERGIPRKDLDHHLAVIMEDKEEWLAFVLEERYGLAAASFPNPVKGGMVMFFVFVACGSIPIIPLLFATGSPALILSAGMTAIALFVVGALKKDLTDRTWTSLGLENLLIGAVTGVVGYAAGVWTGSLLT